MNTHQAYLEWIDQKIHEHQTEIARLTVARSVLEDMPGHVAKAPRLQLAPKRKYHPTRQQTKVVHQRILDHLAEVPMKPIEMLNAMVVGTSKEERRPFYNALARLVKEGVLHKDADGKYHPAAPVLAHQSGTNPT